MQFLQVNLGMIATNCYVLLEETEAAAAVIDPGAAEPALFALLERAGVKKLEYILLTHGHFDHILGVYALKQRFPEACIAIHAADAACLNDENQSRAAYFSHEVQQYTAAQRLLRDAEKLPFAGREAAIAVLHTPGHTPGSVCFLLEKERRIYSGDTLFWEGVGRTDLPGGSAETLRKSLEKLGALPGDWAVFPGHEQETTLEHERHWNPEWSSL